MYYNITLWRVSVDLHVALRIVKVFGFGTEIQQWAPFALLSSYKIFRFAVNNMNVRKSTRCAYISNVMEI
jgi:hypothetical protein